MKFIRFLLLACLLGVVWQANAQDAGDAVFRVHKPKNKASEYLYTLQYSYTDTTKRAVKAFMNNDTLQFIGSSLNGTFNQQAVFTKAGKAGFVYPVSSNLNSPAKQVLYHEDSVIKNSFRILRLLGDNTSTQHDKVGLYSTNMSISRGDGKKEVCIMLIATDYIYTSTGGIPIKVKGKAIRLGGRNSTRVVYTIYYLRKKDLLPVVVKELIATKQPKAGNEDASMSGLPARVVLKLQGGSD